jgi:hypothetical protein
MPMLRSLGAALIGLVTVLALHRLVVIPWHCNVVAGRVSASTDLAVPAAGTDRARAAATSNLARLGECVTDCRTDVSLAMLAATNYRLLSRHGIAAAHLEEALRYERRPELYFELGQTQLEIGAREDALQNFSRAGTFAGTHSFADIADPEIRLRAYAAVGRHQENLLARQGRLDTRNRLAGAVWTAVNGATQQREGGALHVLAPRADSGIEIAWPANEVVPRALTTAWVFVRRGRIYLGSGNGSEPIRNADSIATGRWEKLEALNQTCPVTLTVLRAYGPEGADFLVREVRSRPTLLAPPCDQ